MLDVQVQQDFSGGMFQGPARELIPPNGCARIVNGLLEEDGSVFKRGGSKMYAFGNQNAFVAWDGFLAGGPRTVVVGGGWVTSISSTGVATNEFTIFPLLRRPAAGNGVLYLVTTAGVSLWAGSSKTNGYTAGSLSYTEGSATVTGTGFNGNVEAGMFLVADGIGAFVVRSVESNTSLTLTSLAPKTVTAPTNACGVIDLNQGIGTDAGSPTDAIATVGNPARLCVAQGGIVRFSPSGQVADPTTNGMYNGRYQVAYKFAFNATDYHQLPQGAQVLGMESLRNVLFVFSTQGVFTISGMDFDLTDANGNVQHRLEQINRDIILWDQKGIAGWSGALIVPGTDDVYLMTDSAAPRALSAPIRSLYRSYVARGYQCGGATVYRNHYFLPIMSGSFWVDTLVYRLDQGGWVQWSGQGGESAWMVTRGTTATARSPKLLSLYSTRIKDLSGAFSPNSDNQMDWDGSSFPLEIVTRDYTTGGLRGNLVKKVRLGYELTPPGGGATSELTASVAEGGDTFASLAGGGRPGLGALTETFPVASVRARFVRFKFSCALPAPRVVVKSVEMMTRAGGRQ